MFIVNTLSWLFNYIEKDKTKRVQCCGDAALFFVIRIEGTLVLSLFISLTKT